MSVTNDTKPKRRRSAGAAAGVAILAMLAVGGFAGATAANADGHGNFHGGPPRGRPERGHQGWHQRGRQGWNQHWRHDRYRPPPVVYGPQYGGYPGYYPPPVVYGPGFGVIIGFH